MRETVVMAFVAAVGLAVSVAAQTVNLRPGNYEVTMEMDMPGMPKMPPRKHEQCIASNDLKDLTSGLTALDKTNPDCKMSELKNAGNKVSFMRTCKNGTWTSEMTYSGDSFAGISTGKDSQARPVTMKSTAKRIGDCAK